MLRARSAMQEKKITSILLSLKFRPPRPLRQLSSPVKKLSDTAPLLDSVETDSVKAELHFASPLLYALLWLHPTI